MYEVKRIQSEEEIQSAEPFFMNHFQWRSVYQPKAFGGLALLQEKGLLLSLTCEEADPKRTVCENRVNVCQDSVMEAFLAFPSGEAPPKNSDMYINYEMNANAMLYAKYGAGRQNRQFISEELYEKSNCRAEILSDRWNITLLFPRELFEQLGLWDGLTKGKMFYCNFYKMSECPEMEHYGSYCPLDSETPNFHLPSCFGAAQVR